MRTPYRLSTALHPNTADAYQGLIRALAHYCEGDRFPWLLLTPTQLVLLARAGRITLLSLMEASAAEIAAVTGCDAPSAAEIARRVADDAAYWSGPDFVREAQAAAPQFGPAAPVDFDELRRRYPDYRAALDIPLQPVPGDPFPWPTGAGWNDPMSSLLVGQFEGTGSELRYLLSPQAASLPGLARYLADPYIVAKHEARRGEVKRDLALIAEDAKTYELAQWLEGELRHELWALDAHLDRWLPAHLAAP